MEIQLIISALSLAGLIAGLAKMFRRNLGLLLTSFMYYLLSLVKGIFVSFWLLGQVLGDKLRFILYPRSWLAVSRASRKEHPERYASALSRADSVFDLLSLFLPSRIMKEDSGDAREVIDKRVKASAPIWMIYTKLTFSVFWILLAAIREVLTVTKKKPN